MMTFDVLFPVYINDEPDAVKQALGSVVTQSRLPTRIVVVCDGPTTHDVNSVLEEFVESSPVPVTISRSQRNEGLGRALAKGVLVCDSDFVARMDADDVSLPHRFEEQCRFLEANPDVDVLGGHILEFDSNLRKPQGARKVPIRHDGIVRAMNMRNPFNHMTVMFRRDAVLTAGNYHHAPFYEDFHLWLRMRASGFRFANLDRPLAHVRAGHEMVERRGGTRYLRASMSFMWSVCSGGYLPARYGVAQLGARALSALLPGRVRRGLYRRVLRK